MPAVLRKAAFFAILLLFWQGACSLQFCPDYLLPAPWQVVASLAQGWREGTLLYGLLISLKRMGIGFGLAVLLGGALGLLVGRSGPLAQAGRSLLMGLQSFPSICWFPFAIILLGLQEGAIIFVAVMGAVFSAAIATRDGIGNLPRNLTGAALTLGARGWRLYTAVKLPAALPGIITGLKQSWSFTWRSLMGGELLFGNLGLGHLLMQARDLGDMPRVLGVMLTILLVGMIIEQGLFARLERAVQRRWGLESN
ncbi:MAG: ABC transporter permease [Clostridia bacterium]|nr:ABC transporter permease [Clostridia bacterium]